MGLLKRLFGKGQHPAPNANERVDGIEPPVINVEQDEEAVIPEKPEWEIRQEEAERLAQEGREMRQKIMQEQGVNIDQFTDKKTLDDATALLDEFVPLWKELKAASKKAHVSGEFKNLTKAGKIPKNVFVGSMSKQWDNARTFDYDIICVEIKYKADGSINMADISMNHNGKHISIAIRSKGGLLAISTIDWYDVKRDIRDRLYDGEDIDAKEMLVNDWESIWR